MKEKGLVMEIDGKRMILLTKDGQFISRTISGLNPQIGDETIIDIEKVRKPWFYVRLLSVAALVMITFFTAPLWQQFLGKPAESNVLAYMTVDINPSIELGLDQEHKVVAVHPLNRDGKELLQKLNLTGLTSEQAVEDIIDAACQEGYLKPEKNNQVIINLSEKKPDAAREKDTNQPIITQAKKALSKNKAEANVTILNTDYELREKAEELGISSGKYALLVEAKDAGLNIDVDHVKKSGVVRAIQDAGGNPGEIIQRAQEEKNYQEKIKKWQKEFKETKKPIGNKNKIEFKDQQDQNQKESQKKSQKKKQEVKQEVKQRSEKKPRNTLDPSPWQERVPDQDLGSSKSIKKGSNKDNDLNKIKEEIKKIQKQDPVKDKKNNQIKMNQQHQKENVEVIKKEIKVKIEENIQESQKNKNKEKSENINKNDRNKEQKDKNMKTERSFMNDLYQQLNIRIGHSM
ncbi:anti-sigma factor domain-containing protein [Dehalobacterium formicoaceticum]|uniref:Anti-sigma factor domain-containing protein n=1 Tax=Dehalobacterium formicoaceticum TaxID=51515 RepID=A0ABT1YA48_9FIRM|nr:anti-sigma factor domain-containing protein [Dehalobacterium formicoaceticum]MCR6546804.1 anti-sigma factor domain-containing protein [Dehalobacterium formicoaceticum]